ncbi:hypothetical protein CXB51_029834 [Gossypium anomalum]|uniref:BED-type domain-containing protein n=1 Tax=Gossypium anomalum TaxID=47600 RepID=A0A8J5YZY6_9ROSI|nr:hypothetical protein CXB51_029834 [Gossypium anomalum]
MPPREEFPTKGLEGVPSNDIGWHFGTLVPNTKGNIVCKLCGKVVKGGITRFKEHIAHKTGNVAPCPNVTEDEDEHEEFIDEVSTIRQATRESIQSQHEWHRREEFRRSTGGWNNIYEEGRSSHGPAREYHRERISKFIPSESEFTLSGAIPNLARSKSSKQPKVTSSSWLYNLIQVSTEVGQGVKLPTPYGLSDVYLESKYQRDWVNGLKTHWKELGATLMCDGWTNSLNQMHIINFLVYCSKGTIFRKSVDASSVRSRDAEFFYSLLDSVVEEIGENYIVQIVTDNEAAMKATGKKLMLKRKHLYWTSCAAHCLDLCLEDIGKKPSVAKVLDEAKKVTYFIYNHIWTVDLIKKYTQGKQILRPALTRFATHFIQLEKITRQKQGLREMFNLKQKSGPAYEAKKIVLRIDFWKKANDLIKVYEPLVKVLRLMDSDEKPTMGFIYEAVDRAKQAIQQDCRYFTEHEKIIDNRWNFMHSDLHSADVDPLSEWLHEKENPLLDGENAGVLHVDTSDDEMDVDQSQQQNLSHSSSSSTLSQSGDGPNGGGLSPIDKDDGYNGDREFDGNMFPEPRRDRSELRAPSKGKGKKHTSIGSSSGRRSSSSNLSVSYQPQMHPPPPMYRPPPPLMYPPP